MAKVGCLLFFFFGGKSRVKDLDENPLYSTNSNVTDRLSFFKLFFTPKKFQQVKFQLAKPFSALVGYISLTFFLGAG